MTCRSCGALVLWAQTTIGKRIPLDRQPTPTGNIILLDGVASYITGDPPLDTPRYVSHFATCPHGPSWRRRPPPPKRAA